MGAVWTLARAELRARWPALVGLGLLAALVGSVVLGAVIGARRTHTAFDRLIERTAYWDAELLIRDQTLAAAIASLPQVDTSWLMEADVGQLLDTDAVVYLGLFSGPHRGPDHYRPLLVEGRMFDETATDEVIVSETSAAAFGWSVGSTIDFAGLSQDQMDAFEEGTVPAEPEGTRVQFTVTGLISDPHDALPFETARVIASPAYHSQLAPRNGGLDFLTLRLAHGAQDLDAFQRAVAELDGGGAEIAPDIQSVHDQRRSVDQAVDVVVRALSAFAVVAGFAGLTALAQALGRSVRLRRDELDVHRAIGLDRAQRVAVLVGPLALVAAVAALVSAIGAAAWSVFTPVGIGRAVEPNPGFHLSIAWLTIGALAVGTATILLCGATAAVQVRRTLQSDKVRARASGLVGQVTAVGAPVPVVMGARFAVEPGSGRHAVPTRSALAGVALGVVGVAAAITVIASLDEVSGSPELYGWEHDLTVADADEDALAELTADEHFSSVTGVEVSSAELEGSRVETLLLDSRKGRQSGSVLSGRLPSGPSEVALGPLVAERLDVGEGDTIDAVGAEGGSEEFEVVGIVLTEGPSLYAERAVFDAPARPRLRLGDSYTSAYVSITAGADAPTVMAELSTRREVALPEPPAELRNLGQARDIIGLLAGFLALLGCAALSHALILTVRRRRHNLAVLRALGLTGRQLRSSIRAMAGVILALALVIGVPLGIVVGSTVWAAIAGGIHLPTGAAVPMGWFAALVAAVASVGALLSALPARQAAQVVPAVTLRTE